MSATDRTTTDPDADDLSPRTKAEARARRRALDDLGGRSLDSLPPVLSIAATAALTGLVQRSVRRAVARGDLHAITRPGRRRVLLHRDEVLAWAGAVPEQLESRRPRAIASPSS